MTHFYQIHWNKNKNGFIQCKVHKLHNNRKSLARTIHIMKIIKIVIAATVVFYFLFLKQWIVNFIYSKTFKRLNISSLHCSPGVGFTKSRKCEIDCKLWRNNAVLMSLLTINFTLTTFLWNCFQAIELATVFMAYNVIFWISALRNENYSFMGIIFRPMQIFWREIWMDWRKKTRNQQENPNPKLRSEEVEPCYPLVN